MQAEIQTPSQSFGGIIGVHSGLTPTNATSLIPSYERLSQNLELEILAKKMNTTPKPSNKLILDLMHGTCTEIEFRGKPGAQYSILLCNVPSYGAQADEDGRVLFVVNINTGRYEDIFLVGPKLGAFPKAVTKVKYLLNGTGFETQVSASHSIFPDLGADLLTHLTIQPTVPGSLKMIKLTLDGTPYVAIPESSVSGYVFRFKFDESVKMEREKRYYGLNLARVNSIAIHLPDDFRGEYTLRALVMKQRPRNVNPLTLGCSYPDSF